MAWTTPTVRATLDLITASIYNTDIINNLLYLHGDAGAVTIPQTFSFGATAQMRGHRHPYANERHVESGSGTLNGSGQLAVTFTDAYASNPAVTATPGSNDLMAAITTLSTTGFTVTVHNTASGAGTGTVYWIAEGAD